MQLNLRVLSCTNIPRPEEIVPIDPYIIFNLSYSKTSQRTRVIDNSLDPVWKQDFQIFISEKLFSFGIDISLRSRDFFNEDFEIGSVTGIIEDLKLYEVRKESFKINIVDIDKEKRDAESSSKEISPEHLYTPRFLKNVNCSNTHQEEAREENDETKLSNNNENDNSDNNDKNGTYVSMMFQIAPKFHVPFAKEGTPQRLSDAQKDPNISYRKVNSGFLQNFGAPYIPRGNSYNRYPLSRRGEKPSFNFIANRKQLARNRDQSSYLHRPMSAFGNGEEKSNENDFTPMLEQKSTFPKSYTFGAGSTFVHKYRSRRRGNEQFDYITSATPDDKFNKGSSRFGASNVDSNEAQYAPITSKAASPMSTTKFQRPETSFGQYSDYRSFLSDSYPSPNPKSQNSINFTPTQPTSSPRSYNDGLKYIPPSFVNSAAALSSPGASSAPYLNRSLDRDVPKAFNIFQRNSKPQNVTDTSKPAYTYKLKETKNSQGDPNSTIFHNSNVKFNEIFVKNSKLKKKEKKSSVTSENVLANEKNPAVANLSLKKNQNEKINNLEENSSKKNNQPDNFHSEFLGEVDNFPDFSEFSNNYNDQLIFSDISNDDEDDEENRIYDHHFYRIRSSNDDTISEDDDDYSEMEEDDYVHRPQPQLNPNSAPFKYYYSKKDSYPKRSSVGPTNNNYIYNRYQSNNDDDDQTDTDDVVEIVSPNFNEEQPKAQKKSNFPQAPSTPPFPTSQYEFSTNSAPQIKFKPIQQKNDIVDNSSGDADKKERKTRKDIRFFFSSPEDNTNQTGNIKFVFNNKSQKESKNNDEPAQQNGNSTEATAPMIKHYHAQKKGNSKKQGNRDDSPNNI